MEIMKSRLNAIKEKIISETTKKSILEKQYENTLNELDKIKQHKNILQESILINQKAINETQQSLEFHINPIINASLSEVLDEAYTFNIRFGTRGKNTKTSEIWFELNKNGIVLEDSLKDQVGGGVIHLIALSLRASILMLKKSANKILIFDEPLVALKGKDYPVRAATLLKSLNEKLGIQIIIISHEEALKSIADNLIEL